MVYIPRARRVPRPAFAPDVGLAPVEAAAAPPEMEEPPAPAAPAVEVAMQQPHIDDVPEPGYMGRPDGTPDPASVYEPVPTGAPEIIRPPLDPVPEEALQPYETGRFGRKQSAVLTGLDFAGEVAKRVGGVAPGAALGAYGGAAIAGPVGAAVGGIGGGIVGLAAPMMSDKAKAQSMDIAMGAGKMAGQYSLAMAQIKVQFVTGLAGLLVEAANAQADRKLKQQMPMIAGFRNWMEQEKPAIMDQPQFLGDIAAGDRPKLPREDNTVNNRALVDRIMDLQREEPELFAVLVEKYQEQANQANITINPDVAEAARRRANRPGSSGDARPAPQRGRGQDGCEAATRRNGSPSATWAEQSATRRPQSATPWTTCATSKIGGRRKIA